MSSSNAPQSNDAWRNGLGGKLDFHRLDHPSNPIHVAEFAIQTHDEDQMSEFVVALVRLNEDISPRLQVFEDGLKALAMATLNGQIGVLMADCGSAADYENRLASAGIWMAD
jgi:hypothetical protein